MAQAVRALDCPLGAVTRLSAGGGALPVITPIIGPRETHDYRNYNLLVRGINSSKKQAASSSRGPESQEGGVVPCVGDCLPTALPRHAAARPTP